MSYLVISRAVAADRNKSFFKRIVDYSNRIVHYMATTVTL